MKGLSKRYSQNKHVQMTMPRDRVVGTVQFMKNSYKRHQHTPARGDILSQRDQNTLTGNWRSIKTFRVMSLYNYLKGNNQMIHIAAEHPGQRKLISLKTKLLK